MELVYKHKYSTCLKMLKEFRKGHPELEHETLAYAGILDPMAEGVVPVLVGKQENQNRVYYTQADKHYQVDVLLGISTDTYDLLGLLTEYRNTVVSDSATVIEAFLAAKNPYRQTVPMFSNKKYKGKSLWEWGRAGIFIPEEERPVNIVTIKKLEVVQGKPVTKQQLNYEVKMMQMHIPEGFRLDEVYQRWCSFIQTSSHTEWQTIQMKMNVSKGFYVRKFVEDVSRIVHVPMVVFSLKRTKVIL